MNVVFRTILRVVSEALDLPPILLNYFYSFHLMQLVYGKFSVSI